MIKSYQKTIARLGLMFTLCGRSFLSAQPFPDASVPATAGSNEYPLAVGFRASYNLSNYPRAEFPSPGAWTSLGQRMAKKFSGAMPSTVWIVCLYLEDGYTQLGFPSSRRYYPYLSFAPYDYSERYLASFDTTSVKVWLQVEPGAANVDTLIDLVLRRYGHHPCVEGFGIDVEWYQKNLHSMGRRVTDEEAQRWEHRVKSHNPRYTLFLKHFSDGWMPPTYQGDIMFVDDSQRFPSLVAMLQEFKKWGARFFPNRVAFQLGYPADAGWWQRLPDPLKDNGEALIAAIPNASGLFWVDFTLSQVFPLAQTTYAQPVVVEEAPVAAVEAQNLPNPFNENTWIFFTLVERSTVRIEVRNVLGELLTELVNQEYDPGMHHLQWDGTDSAKTRLPTGVYYYRITTPAGAITRNMILQR